MDLSFQTNLYSQRDFIFGGISSCDSIWIAAFYVSSSNVIETAYIVLIIGISHVSHYFAVVIFESRFAIADIGSMLSLNVTK